MPAASEGEWVFAAQTEHVSSKGAGRRPRAHPSARGRRPAPLHAPSWHTPPLPAPTSHARREHPMSHLLDRLTFFTQPTEPFSDAHGLTTGEDRTWEDAYRNRWQHDRIVRSTPGTNGPGSCSWKIYVKGGIVTWETQQTDYPRTRPDLPNHEPRGCARGASYSWYLYSANRVKYPLVRARLMKAWRAARAKESDPVRAWAAVVDDEATRRDYQRQRGLGGFVRADWDE